MDLELKVVTCINANGQEMTPEQWSDGNLRCFGMLLDGRAQTTGIKQRGHEATMLIIINAYHDVVTCTLPESPGGAAWRVVMDTNIDTGREPQVFQIGDEYQVTGRSLLLFVLDAE